MDGKPVSLPEVVAAIRSLIAPLLAALAGERSRRRGHPRPWHEADTDAEPSGEAHESERMTASDKIRWAPAAAAQDPPALRERRPRHPGRGASGGRRPGPLDRCRSVILVAGRRWSVPAAAPSSLSASAGRIRTCHPCPGAECGWSTTARQWHASWAGRQSTAPAPSPSSRSSPTSTPRRRPSPATAPD